MRIFLKFLCQIVIAICCAVLFAPVGAKGSTSFVYDTGTEILTSGDFDGDGTADVLVLDKFTGNVRIGLLDTGGNLGWSAPLVTGVENVTGAAVGKFFVLNADSLAVTAPEVNHINLISLANTNAAGSPLVITPSGLGPHTLVALDNPLGVTAASPTNLLVASSQNAGGAELMERLQVASGAFYAPPVAQFNESGLFDRGNSLALTSSNSPSFAAGLVRGASADRFDILQFTNGAGGILISYTNLPAGGDYVFGNFNGEILPRIAFYQPGASNFSVVSVVTNAIGLQFGTNISITVTETVQQVYYLPPAVTGTFLVEFADGVQAIQFSGNTAKVGAVYRGGLGSSNNVFTGIVPLADGRFALLDAAAGAAASTHAQVVKFDGTNFARISSSAPPAISTGSTRADVWLFQTEPFVNRDSGLVASFTSPDWSDQISGLPGIFSVVKESDGGSGSGLGNLITNTLGAPPTGANFGLPNQVADGISIFSYAPPRAAEPVTITISPPPGIYSGAIQVSFSTLAAGDSVFYRAGSADGWHSYSAAFQLTNDAAVEYYGVNLSGARSRLLTADYVFANNVSVSTTVNLTNGFPITNNTSSGTSGGGNLILSRGGTVFYGRKDSASGTIWAINLDGSGDTYITTGARPRVSRDGRYLAFMRGANVFAGTGGDLWLRDLSTGTEQELFTNNLQIIGYDWDTSNPPNLIFDYGCSFWKVSVLDTAAVFPMSNNCYFAAPTVNPVSGNLAFFDYNSGGGIRTVPASGGTSTHVGSTVFNSRWPAWSPDGAQLSFSFLNNPFANYGMADLYTVNADGTGLAQITAFTNADEGFLYSAIWTPDGNGLLGAGSIYGTNGLWLIPLTADGQRCNCPAKLLPTTAGEPIDFAGSVIVAPAAVVAKPGLFIRLDSNVVVVYWSTNYQGFSLQANSNIGTSSSWTDIDGPYFQNGVYYEYHEARAALAATKFFRLQNSGAIVIQPLHPKLSLQYQSGQAVLTWPTNYVGYALESATNLSLPVAWQPLGVSIVNTNGQFEFRRNLSLQREFFRLHLQ